MIVVEVPCCGNATATSELSSGMNMALAVVLSFILTLLLGFEDIPVEEAAAQARKHQSVQPTIAKEVSLN